MKFLVTIFVIAGLLYSCNSSDKSADTVAETSTEAIVDSAAVVVNYVPIDTDQALIATALMAAPAASRDGAKVIGYNTAGEFVTLREGDNEFIVLVDDSNRKGFNAACYQKDLEPFMARGRALRAEGKTREEVFAVRKAEMESGELSIPMGATLHLYFGPNTNYDPQTGEVEGAKLRYVVYLPFATAASTGLPESPIASNHPWIMEPGTHRAHIMISPLSTEN